MEFRETNQGMGLNLLEDLLPDSEQQKICSHGQVPTSPFYVCLCVCLVLVSEGVSSNGSGRVLTFLITVATCC